MNIFIQPNIKCKTITVRPTHGRTIGQCYLLWSGLVDVIFSVVPFICCSFCFRDPGFCFTVFILLVCFFVSWLLLLLLSVVWCSAGAHEYCSLTLQQVLVRVCCILSRCVRSIIRCVFELKQNWHFVIIKSFELIHLYFPFVLMVS